MPSICFYFQVHQPNRLRHYTFFDIGNNSLYEDDTANHDSVRKMAKKCWLPANTMLLDCINEHKGAFKVAFSITGTALEQFERFCPEVLDSFKALAATDCVEFIAESYYHSLACLQSPAEFQRQVSLHCDAIEKHFGQRPTTFRNTELIYNNDLAKTIEQMGFTTILAEGADHVLGWRSPHLVYQPVNCRKLHLLLRSYSLSDDIALRFSDNQWAGFPLTAEKFANWAHALDSQGECLNLFMDYSSFGEKHSEGSGIFNFMRALPHCILQNPDFCFQTPSEVSKTYPPLAKLDVPDFMSWADLERDLTAWHGNDMQRDALNALFQLEDRVLKQPQLLPVWRRLQSSDNFYYMCTKWFADNKMPKYHNPFQTPYDAYITFMNVLGDFELCLAEAEHLALERQQYTLSLFETGNARVPALIEESAESTEKKTTDAAKTEKKTPKKAASTEKSMSASSAEKKTSTSATKSKKTEKSTKSAGKKAASPKK